MKTRDFAPWVAIVLYVVGAFLMPGGIDYWQEGGPEGFEGVMLVMYSSYFICYLVPIPLYFIFGTDEKVNDDMVHKMVLAFYYSTTLLYLFMSLFAHSFEYRYKYLPSAITLILIMAVMTYYVNTAPKKSK